MIPSPKQIAFAHQLADASAAVIRPYYRSGLAIDDKSDASPVTQADREAELAMRALINECRPQDGIIGEEFGTERDDADWVWVLDPVDGTKAFITGRPLFVTLIGLLYRGVPVLGVINQPIAHERWVGVVGQGATLNDQPITVSEIAEMSRARIGTTGPQYFSDAGRAAFMDLQKNGRFTVYGGDGYQYALVATGGLDLVIEEGLKLHDFAAVAPVVIAAGGIMTDWQGEALTRTSSGRVIAAATPAMYQIALNAMKAV
ncbi:histidinol-phosphatase [Chitinibacter bivalviorum]|uniref:Histidinol-phosphatase n=1 Tax=Chitinibacter bivalviorum TaxID=2739434 RepID=A0A7H9BF72_9NEIS|nr:histidinol-phosphatase [Chitinibacter bivalviorum]QLG87215.1 histidinol-phosphatase [Chitinibacter bivalviorum]